MSDRKHVQPRLSADDGDLAFVDAQDFESDPSYYVDWVADNRVDLAVQTSKGKKLLLGLGVGDETPTGGGSQNSGITSIAIDKKTLARNLDDVVEVLRSGNVNAQLRINEPQRQASVYLYSEGKSVLSSAKRVDFTRPINELIELVQKERVRQADEPPNPKPAPEPENDLDTDDWNDIDWTLDYGDDGPRNLRERVVRLSETAGKLVIRTVKVTTEKVVIPAGKYACEVWQERDRGVTGIKDKVVEDAKQQLRDRGFLGY